MSEAAAPSDRRAQLVCLTGFFLQTALFGVVLAVGLSGRYQSDAVVAGARHLLGGVAIWLILFIIFTQRKRSHLEDLETEQLQRAQEAGVATNIFDVADESMLLERRRLNWTYKFLLPTFTVVIAAYHIGGSFLLWPWSLGQALGDTAWQRAGEPFVPMVFMGGSAFCCFLFGRYVIGVAAQSQWRLLRAGGSYLIGNALTASLLVVAMALAGNKASSAWAEPLAAYVIRIAVLLLGIEFLANFVLDFYRPRRPDEPIRPAFDSRLLSLFSEPRGIMRSIADTMNYQFGFEVSSTWFYQLLRRSIFPLVMMTVLALIALSAVVIVDVDEQAVVMRFGKPLQEQGRTIGPGFHLKLPWPIDHVERARVDMVRTLMVGSTEDGADDAEQNGDGHQHEDETKHAVLWTEEHDLNTEMMMLVANRDAEAETAGESRRSRSVSVSLLMISMSIEYRIKDLYDYKFNYQEPERVLESIAYQELSDYASGVDIAVLMGSGRRTIGTQLERILQRRCDDLELGIEISFVALQDAHPPSKSDVAKAFQDVVAAEIRQSAAIAQANGEADRMLTMAAGSVERAQALNAAIQEMDSLTAEAERLNTPEANTAAAQAVARVDDLLLGNQTKRIPPASGSVAAVIDRARGAKSAAVSVAESKTRTFHNDLIAYRAAPRLFKMRRYLDMLRETLPGLRKFVITGDKSNLIIEYVTEQRSTLDLETAEPP